MEKIELRFLGGFEIRFPDGRVSSGPGTKKAGALLACLAMQDGKPVRREVLGTMLWGRSSDRQAANSLNQAIYSLRKHFTGAAADPIGGDSDNVWINPDCFSSDVRDFEKDARSDDPETIEKAWSSYQGPLLEGLNLAEPGFEDWLRAERQRLEDLAVAAGEQILHRNDMQPDERSAAVATTLLTIDPYDEYACRHLMRYHASRGHKSEALKLFENCKSVLATDLGIAPSEATLALRDRIAASEAASEAIPFREQTSGSAGKPSSQVHGGRPRHLASLIAVVAVACLLVVTAWFVVDLSGPLPVLNGLPRIAVLPFETEQGGDDGAIFATGLADDIATELQGIPNIAVIARATVEVIASDPDIQPRNLGVTYLLRGRVRLQQDRLTVNSWLVDTRKREQVWAERYTGSRTDIALFQDRIVNSVADALVLKFSEGAGQKVPGEPEGDPQVYETYLAGLVAYNRGTPADNRIALDLFGKALDADASFVRARAGISNIYYDAAYRSQDFASALGINWLEAYVRLKEQLADRDLSESAPGLVLRSRLALHRRDQGTAVALAGKALNVQPSNVDARAALAEALIYSGRLDEGRSHARATMQLNPARPAFPTYLLGLADYTDGEIEAAIVRMQEAIGSTPHADAVYFALLAAAYGEKGNPAAAAAPLESFVAALQDRPRNEWRDVTRDFSNPRATTWLRPTLAEAVYAFPFSDDAVLARLAKGLEIAGIAGSTVGYLTTGADNRLEAGDGKRLLFGSTVTGLGIPSFAGSWSQTRSPTGFLEQSGIVGPMPFSKRGQSRMQGHQLCDRWISGSISIESCSSLFGFSASESGHASGRYVMATEFAPFVFTSER